MNRPPPGRVQDDAPAEVVAMLCTAGHVDHGKTSLVKALTGCATDRLREEIERGMTIELGFAPCRIGGELCAGIVDVPGHERFVRTMVSGVSGIDFCILVIAADDGIMPQTREHLDIMELMGLRRGMVALTKTDLVPPEQVAARRAEIAAWLETSFLRGAPIRPVSTVTGEGYGEFYDTLAAGVKSGLRDRRSDVFRMPVERTFPRPGFGAVVTGIPVAGELRLGDALECVPGGQRGHVRGLQCFGRTAERGGAGQCLALNIPEFGKVPPARGAALAAPGLLRAGSQIHARLRIVPRLDPPLKNAEEVSFHTGTAERHGHVYLLEEKHAAAGASMLATVVFEEPVAAAPGDRFILRRLSPAATVGGGRILRMEEEARRPRRKVILAALQEQERFLGDADWDSPEGQRRRIAYALAHEPPAADTAAGLGARTLLPPETVSGILERLVADGRVLPPADGWYADAARYAALRAELARRAQELALSTGRLRVPLGEWRAGHALPAALWEKLGRDLQQSGDIRIAGDSVLPAGGLDGLPAGDRELAERILALFESEGYETTLPAEVPAKVGAPPARTDKLLQYLIARGDLARVAPNVILTAARLRAAQTLVVELIQRQGTLGTAEFRDRLGVSRKYALAILEFLDARKITLRSQNDRKLLPGWESRRW